ncbi:MAG: hypothetical protein Kow0056_13380 [Coriobacteriia bacterium]
MSSKVFRKSLALVLALALAALLLPVAASATGSGSGDEYYVDVVNGSDTTGDGSAGNPWQSITLAMSQPEVDAGDTIWVKPGTYDTSTETFPIEVKPGVMLRSTGGAESTVLDAEGSERVLQITAPADGSWEDTWVKGFTITGGHTTGSGAGIFITSEGTTEPTAGWPKIMHNRIVSNSTTSTGSGGGIYVMGYPDGWVSPYIYDNVFMGNVSGNGGALSLVYSGATVECSTITSNTGSVNGGGVHVWGPADVTVKSSTIESNTAVNGGGLYMYGSVPATLTIEDCTVANNTTAGGTGGGIQSGGGESELIVRRTRIEGNVAELGGGGLYVQHGLATISDSAFVENGHPLADGGVARTFGGAEVEFTHVTAYGNIGDFEGLYSLGATETVRNSIFWGNGSHDMAMVELVEYSITEQTNLAGWSNTEGSAVSHDDPLLWDAAAGDLRLRPGSPAIDAGLPGDSWKDIEKQARPQDGDGDGSAKPDLGCWEKPEADSERYAGTDRYDTACKAVRDAFDYSYHVVIASGENFPDALSASGLAGAYDAPLLLVRKDSVPSVVMNTIRDLGAGHAFVVGGPNAVSNDVVTALQNEGLTVHRKWGSDRYETSAEVARQINDAGDVDTAFFARGDTYPDALAVGPMAFTSGQPVLLVAPDWLPDDIAEVIDDVGITTGYVCGGEGAVSAATKQAIDDALIAEGGSASTRWWGHDRYETAAEIAKKGVEAGFTTWEYVGLATGENYPDALSGGVATGAHDGVLLLTRSSLLPDVTKNAIQAHQADVLFAEVFGGSKVVEPTVESELENACGW